MHVQLHGPEPARADDVPVLQRLVGVVERVVPLDEPQTPFTGGGGASCAEQLAFVPPFAPEQDDVHGPVPATVDAVPVLQRLFVGFEATVVPFDVPHTPFTGVGGVSCAEHEAVAPPLRPAHDQVHGPVPDTVEDVPVLQRLVVGFDATVVPFAVPQMPFTGAGACGVSWAEQLAFVPPLEPAHDQLHGPVPLTVDAVPVLRKLVGVVESVAPFEEPHTPFTATGGGDDVEPEVVSVA